jgi:hypothetical protein
MTQIGERYLNSRTSQECYVTRIWREPGMTMEAMVELSPTDGGEPMEVRRRDFWRDWNLVKEG